MSEVGTRVGAISHDEEDAVYLFGYGIYEGMHVHPDLGLENPRIKLDSGKIVWGCECWWGPEEKVRSSIGDRFIVLLDIDEERKKAQEAAGE